MTRLLTHLLGRLPIGWLQLTHNRACLFAAVAAFANILVLVQLGIMRAFGESVRMSYRTISASDAYTFVNGSNIARQWLHRALSVSGVGEADLSGRHGLDPA